jgi:outer membrane protein TolC
MEKAMKVSHIAIFVGLNLCLSIGITAQNNDRFSSSVDNFTVELPPLSVVIDSAYSHDASLKGKQLEVDLQKFNLRISKNYWTRNIGVSTDIRYGTFDHFNTSYNELGAPTNSTMSSTETRYGVGAYMKFPLQDLVSRGSEKKVRRMEIQKAEQVVEMRHEEIRQLVIGLYNDLVLKQRIFKIKIKQYETAHINMQMAEKEFVNGVIAISEYSRLTQITSGAEIDFENSRMELINAVMILEEITGIKLNVHKSTPESDENH